MDIDMIFKIAGVGIIVAILHTVLEQLGNRNQAQLVALAGVVVVLLMVVQMVYDLFDTVKTMFRLN